MSKWYAIPLFLGLILVAAWMIFKRGGAPSNGDARHAPQSDSVIALFGDGLAQEPAVIAALTPLTPHAIQSHAVVGDTTESARQRLTALQSIKANVVVILLGAQDLRQHVPLDATLANLNELFAAAAKTGALVAYVVPEVPGIGDNWSMAVHDLARREGVLLIENAPALWSSADALDRDEAVANSVLDALGRSIAKTLSPYLPQKR